MFVSFSFVFENWKYLLSFFLYIVKVSMNIDWSLTEVCVLALCRPDRGGGAGGPHRVHRQPGGLAPDGPEQHHRAGGLHRGDPGAHPGQHCWDTHSVAPTSPPLPLPMTKLNHYLLLVFSFKQRKQKSKLIATCLLWILFCYWMTQKLKDSQVVRRADITSKGRSEFVQEIVFEKLTPGSVIVFRLV